MIIRSGANDATRTTNELYALQKSYECPIYNTAPKHLYWRGTNSEGRRGWKTLPIGTLRNSTI